MVWKRGGSSILWGKSSSPLVVDLARNSRLFWLPSLRNRPVLAILERGTGGSEDLQLKIALSW
jgi:hypothetical protein